MRRFLKLSALLVVLLVGATSCSTYHWKGTASTLCITENFGAGAQCTIKFTSAENFNWTAYSAPDGATFQPSSGSEAAGVTSEAVHVTIPHSVCSGTLYFTDDVDQIQLTFYVQPSCRSPVLHQ